MSDKEDTQEGKEGGKGRHRVIVVNQQASADSRMEAYPSDTQDESSDLIHKRSKIPGIPSVAVELKEAGTTQRIEVKKQESAERNPQIPLPTGLPKNQVTNMLSSNSHIPEIVKPFESIGLNTLESEPVLKVIPPEPIPVGVKPTKSRASLRAGQTAGDDASDEAAVTDDVAVLPTREGTRLSDWSDDQEAGGLPRTESRSSRVSRAVRQLFCCGVAYSPASEEDLSTERAFSAI